jgi:hypothetical protein
MRAVAARQLTGVILTGQPIVATDKSTPKPKPTK